MMKRYLTTESEDGCIEAWPEDMAERIAASDNIVRSLWVFAESDAEAIQMHRETMGEIA